MSDLRISIGNDFDVIESGTVITHDNNKIILQIQGLSLIFKFKFDSKIQETTLSSESIDNKSLLLILTNYNNPLGQGLLRPIEVGKINGRKLFLTFMVYSLNNTGAKTFHFELLTEKINTKNEQK